MSRTDDRRGDKAEALEAVGDRLLLGDDLVVERAEAEFGASDGALLRLEVDAAASANSAAVSSRCSPAQSVALAISSLIAATTSAC